MIWVLKPVLEIFRRIPRPHHFVHLRNDLACGVAQVGFEEDVQLVDHGSFCVDSHRGLTHSLTPALPVVPNEL